MSNIWTLVAYQLKSSKEKPKLSLTQIVIKWVVRIIFASMLLMIIGGLLFGVSLSIFQWTDNPAIHRIIFSTLLGSISVIILITGVSGTMTNYYYANDLEHMLPLPIKSFELIASKFICSLLYQYAWLLFIMMPIFIAYGQAVGVGISFYIASLLILLLLPISPLAIVTLIVIAVMSLTRVGKKINTLKFIGGIVGIILFLSAEILVFNYKTDRSSNPTEHWVQLIDGFGTTALGQILNWIPSAAFGANALLLSGSWRGWFSLTLLVGVTTLCMIMLLILGSKMYTRSIIGSSESTSKKMRLSSLEVNIALKERSHFVALINKEWATIMRTPTLFINLVLVQLFVPIGTILFWLKLKDEIYMMELGSMILTSEMISKLLVLTVAAGLCVSGLLSAASTSISREGKGFDILKFLPVRSSLILNAKLIVSFLLVLPSITSVILILGLLVQLPIWLIVL